MHCTATATAMRGEPERQGASRRSKIRLRLEFTRASLAALARECCSAWTHESREARLCVCLDASRRPPRQKKKKGKRIEIEIKHRHLNGVGELHRSRATARCNHVATPEPFVQLWSGCPVLRLKLGCQKAVDAKLSLSPLFPLDPHWLPAGPVGAKLDRREHCRLILASASPHC